MHVYWESITKPLLRLLRPSVIVQVGCEEGLNTPNLLGYCEKAKCELHIIDPEPRVDAGLLGQWRRDFTFRLHRESSLDVLPGLGAADLVLLDGDPDRATVRKELLALEELGAAPLLLLHDLDWPSGRNEVGRALEEHLRETEIEWELFTVPVFDGLGILCPRARMERHEALARFLRNLDRELVRGGLLEKLERERLRLLQENLELRRGRAQAATADVLTRE